jgi:AraC-like DNA-binding protein
MRFWRQDSILGRWTQGVWQPLDLCDVVDQIWYFEGHVAAGRERVFPSGRAELVLQLGGNYSRVDGDTTEPFSVACVNGIMLHPEVIEAPGEPSIAIGVRFFPAGAFGVFPMLREMTDRTVDVSDLLGASTSELIERCEAATTPSARLRVVADWIRRRLMRSSTVTPAVAWAAAEIERNRGLVSIAELIDRSGWSKSRFTERFKHETGVSPKVLGRIVRFQHSAEMLRTTDHPLAETALAAGYYDQSHFTGEFRCFAGMTPGSYRAAGRHPDSVNLVESR